MHEVSEQPSEPFPTDDAVIHDRVRRRLAGVLRQLDRRIAELESALESGRRLEGDLSAERQRVEHLQTELARARSEMDRLRGEVASTRAQYDQLLATKTFRLLAVPRRVYGLALRARRLPRD